MNENGLVKYEEKMKLLFLTNTSQKKNPKTLGITKYWSDKMLYYLVLKKTQT